VTPGSPVQNQPRGRQSQRVPTAAFDTGRATGVRPGDGEAELPPLGGATISTAAARDAPSSTAVRACRALARREAVGPSPWPSETGSDVGAERWCAPRTSARRRSHPSCARSHATASARSEGGPAAARPWPSRLAGIRRITEVMAHPCWWSPCTMNQRGARRCVRRLSRAAYRYPRSGRAAGVSSRRPGGSQTLGVSARARSRSASSSSSVR
jgi:hypothetical protein